MTERAIFVRQFRQARPGALLDLLLAPYQPARDLLEGFRSLLWRPPPLQVKLQQCTQEETRRP